MKKSVVLVIVIAVILLGKQAQSETTVKFKDIKNNFQEYWGKDKVKLIETDEIYCLFVIKAGEKYFVASYGTGRNSTEAGGLANIRFQIWLLNKSGVPEGITVILKNARCQGKKFWGSGHEYIAMALYPLSDDITIDGEKLDINKIIQSVQ
jgi:hypothetical protein